MTKTPPNIEQNRIGTIIITVIITTVIIGLGTYWLTQGVSAPTTSPMPSKTAIASPYSVSTATPRPTATLRPARVITLPPISINGRGMLGTMLSSECLSPSHIANSADHIAKTLAVRAPGTGANIFNLQVINWEKGRRNETSIEVTTDTHGESVQLENGHLYDIYLKDIDNTFTFVCGFRGAVDLGRSGPTCIDTDGRDYFTKGSVTVVGEDGRIWGPFTDLCLGPSPWDSNKDLMDEELCMLTELVECPGRCNNGACVRQ